MKYALINPVTASMYDDSMLAQVLAARGYARVYCEQDWARRVRAQYVDACAQSADTVADVRCPEVRALLESAAVPGLVIPKIDPILICCAREIAARKSLAGCEKWIITPCDALADAGNALGLAETRFLSWRRFLKDGLFCPRACRLKESPIPPGFFSGAGLRTASVSPIGAVRSFLNGFEPRRLDLVEMLACSEGCHNGDGVMPDE